MISQHNYNIILIYITFKKQFRVFYSRTACKYFHSFAVWQKFKLIINQSERIERTC
jgi:hypothetical protein